MLDDIKGVKVALNKLSQGLNSWPKAQFELTFDLKQLASANKESITQFAQRMFAVLGTNCEMFAVFTGFWDETLTASHLGERAEKMASLHQGYDYLNS